ncbi:UDP-2,4-diacetamido-2,4,6-trideoxy-beta-L-altropyranose hydrolase [Gracilimonas sp.]|uniref:UDP-2,4-diacetamido-2,4, 6-trideoxy-beta-L-altropyranose hydrolase n=1 Tax=Gracilimonas sp. TaxID=1974203 RepID=UPI003BAD3BB4
MKEKVYIRADGSAFIGLGHIVRCISLGHMLKEDFSIQFYAMEMPHSLKNEITQNGWEVTVIDQESEFLSELKGLEIVVLDGYQFDSNYQKEVKNKGCKLVCIDDFHNQHFYADLVINHAPGLTKNDYAGESYTKYLLGPDYALLRPEFLNGKPKSGTKSNEIKKIFICFGGSDIKNQTAKILSWLPSKDYSITAVLGNAYMHKDILNKVIEKRTDLEIFVKDSLSDKEMRQELEQADLAIVPASGILFEVVATGLPVISGYYTNNQMAIYKGFLEEGVIIDADSFSEKSLNEAFSKLANLDLVAMVNKQKKLIDSNVKNRINNRFLELC